MVLVAGQAADRFNRGRIIGLCLSVQTVCLAAFGALALGSTLSVGPVYLLLVVIGVAQAFFSPAMSAVLPRLVTAQELPRAVALSSASFQTCTLVRPALGGLLYGLSRHGVFAFSTALCLTATLQVRRLAEETQRANPEVGRTTDRSPLGGIRYIRSNRFLLVMISLDLFAVLLGGITSLLPIYARDILAVGPVGLGCLRCAPSIGATFTGLILARYPIQRGTGKLMLACVAGFGLATIVFALSTNLCLSLAALIAAGGFDMVSMVIRHTLAQLSTPDAMRGRVSAVQWLFISASSELGEFESGVTAALFGTVAAGWLGGLGTLAVVVLWAKIFPELLETDRLLTEETMNGAMG